jgi:hypothetical protein
MPPTVKELVEKYRPDRPLRSYGSVYTDTSEFMDIGYGDVIALDGRHYLVLRDELERRFGIEDFKFWVKRCSELETGQSRILKLVFHERFPMKIGTFEVMCYRSPKKEGRILDLVRGDRRFMQGFTVEDEMGNAVRVLELIRGKRLDEKVDAIPVRHEEYFFEHLPDYLERFIDACEAIAFLHAHGEKHGDIRRDHLWVEHGERDLRWIDFDYTFDFHENPFGLDIFGLGNILLFLVGKRIETKLSLAEAHLPDEFYARLDPGDFSLLFKSRLVNLGKLYDYVPEELNRVLMHFSAASEVFYWSVEEFLDELRPCVDLIRKG